MTDEGPKTSEPEGEVFNLKKWLEDNRLASLIPQFEKDQVQIEELVEFSPSELR